MKDVRIFGDGLWLKADTKAAVVYVYGEPVRTYYRMNGGLDVKLVTNDCIEHFSKKEPYADMKDCRKMSRFIVSDKVTCKNV
jgi:hypothetical protein